MSNQIDLTLPWVDKIRERLEDEYEWEEGTNKFKHFKPVLDFIKPILEYGKKEEDRISEEIYADDKS